MITITFGNPFCGIAAPVGSACNNAKTKLKSEIPLKKNDVRDVADRGLRTDIAVDFLAGVVGRVADKLLQFEL